MGFVVLFAVVVVIFSLAPVTAAGGRERKREQEPGERQRLLVP